MTITAFKAPGKDAIKILTEETVYQGFFGIKRYAVQYQLFAGGWSQTHEREVFDKCGAACVLLYDPTLDQVVLIQQFRIGAMADPESPWLIELVAGLLEPGETPEELAVRETQEEAGLDILDLHFICRYWVTPGVSTEQVTLFCARVDANKANGIHGLVEEDEDILVQAVPFAQAWQALEQAQIKNAPTIIGLQWLKLHKSLLQEKWRS